MKKIILFASAIILRTTGISQNIISNPGFEAGSIPNNENQVPFATDWEVGCATNYSAGCGCANIGTPDLFDSRSINCAYDIPQNKWSDWTNVNTAGTYRYVGFTGFSNNYGLQYFNESVKGKITQTLVSGCTYTISFFVSAISGY